MLRSLEFHSEFLSIETVPYISRSIWTIRRRSAPLIWKKWHLFKFTKTTYYSTRRLRRECRRWLFEAAIGKCMPICSERGLIQIILGEQPIFEVG